MFGARRRFACAFSGFVWWNPRGHGGQGRCLGGEGGGGGGAEMRRVARITSHTSRPWPRGRPLGRRASLGALRRLHGRALATRGVAPRGRPGRRGRIGARRGRGGVGARRGGRGVRRAEQGGGGSEDLSRPTRSAQANFATSAADTCPEALASRARDSAELLAFHGAGALVRHGA